MTLRNKIFFGYLILFLVFAGGILLSLRTLGPIERSFERLAAENLPVLNLVQDIRTHGIQLHAEMLEMSSLLSLPVTPESTRALDQEKAEIEHTHKQLLASTQQYFKMVEMYFPDESSYIPLLQTQIDQLVLLNNEINSQTAGQSGSFSLAIKSRFEELEQSFLAITNEIVSYEVREVQMRRENVTASVSRARLMIGATIFISLAITLILTIRLTRLSSASEPSGEKGRRLNPEPRRNRQRD